MICFKDKSFCSGWHCSKAETCADAYSKEVEDAATLWWGEDGAPISVDLVPERRECFERKKH